MTSQDDLALLKQMHQRGEITDAQYDVLRRHVLWGTPLPRLADDVPAPRAGADPLGGYVPGAATVGPDRHPDAGGARYATGRYAPEPGGGRYPVGAPEPAAGPGARRYASRRERREAEEAGTYSAPTDPTHLPPAGYLPPAGGAAPARRSTHRRDEPPEDLAPAGTAVDDADSRSRRGRVPADVDSAGRRGWAAAADVDSADRRGRAAAADVDSAGRRGRAAADVDSADRRGRVAADVDSAGRPGPVAGADVDSAGRRSRVAETDLRARRRAAGDGDPEPRGRVEGRARKRPRRRSVVAVLTSVVLALALAAGGVYWFVLRTDGLPPTTYARQACGTVRDWQQSVDSSNATLINRISRQENKTTVRADVAAYYTTIAGRTDQLRTAILGLGAADLTGGREYADSLAAAVGDQASALRRLADRADRLDPAAPTFATDLQAVLTGADAAVSAVSAALARPAAGITTELRTTLSNDPACAPYVG